MPEAALRPDEIFAFRHLARALDGFEAPRQPFAPDGAWTATYDLVERSARQIVHGALRLERTPEADGRFRLRLALRKQSGGGVMQARGDILCQADALSSPLSWSLESDAVDRAGQPVPDLHLSEQGQIAAGQVRLRRGGRERLTPLHGPVTMDWCLFDAVQRLPRGMDTALRFGLLDRLGGSIKDEQVLSRGPDLSVTLGGERVWQEVAEPLEAGTRYRPVEALEGASTVPLQCFEQVGQGILPTTYWVDPRGQLLFVLAGLAAWILNPKAQV